MRMTITTSGPQETAKTRQASQATAPTKPKPIAECVTVTKGPPDASTSDTDASEANSFRSSKKRHVHPHRERQSHQPKPTTSTTPRTRRALTLESRSSSPSILPSWRTSKKPQPSHSNL
jgi:hypothetical protein